MGALPRPDLAPGPARDLNDALHDLHHRAGWPSLRTLAGDAGCSHTTVSHVFSSPKLPTWGVVELLVEAMGGSTSEFHELWLAASAPASTDTRATPRIAGRRTELAAVRRHLESGSGLLLVTGEAGMGKTKLVSTAAAGSDAFVATGTCRPLSTEVPLLPISELFRQVSREDAAWFEEALDQSPGYVRESMAQLLPELGTSEPAGLSEEWARQRLFHATSALLNVLRERRPLGVVIEDGHWADATTLDLLELLGGQPSPLVVTWRTDDPDIPSPYGDWLTRVRRLPGATILTLGPLTPEETAEQLALLGGDPRTPEEVQRIHARSLGQPLFTEQLALHPDDRPLPELLADLLKRGLRTLSAQAWQVARGLGVADRPLMIGQLALVSGFDPVAGLRELDERRLLGPGDDQEIRLRHPLVADAIRDRLAPGEASHVHRAVAGVLAALPHPPAAEIAQHWAAAGDAGEELPWRIEAARAASARFAVESAAGQWQRVLDLWPDDLREAGEPPLARAAMHIAALDAIMRLDYTSTPRLIAKALEAAQDAAPEHAAAIELRAGEIHSWLGEPEAALELGARAVAAYEDLPPCREHVVALHALRASLEGVGRYQEGAELTVQAVTESRRAGLPSELKQALAQRAWHQSRVGDLAGARASVDELRAIVLEPPDPYCEIDVAVCTTDMLLMTGAPAEELIEVAKPALDAADTWGLHQWADAILRFNVCEALILEGDTQRAWEFIAPYSEGDPVQERWPLHEQRAVLELLAGRLDEARRQVASITTERLTRGGLAFRLEFNSMVARIDLWDGEPADALARALSVLESGHESEEPAMLAPLLVVAARAAADLRSRTAGERLRGLHRQLARDPFGPHPMLVTPAAFGATWTAELARLDGAHTVEQWVSAATAWDKLSRPHDSAYCRWRAAQVAVRAGQGTVASRLLKHAAADARQHVPLTEAIATTLAGAR